MILTLNVINQVYVYANEKPSKPKSLKHKKESYMRKKGIKFSLMCPGISLSTLTHDLTLHGRKSFEQICNQLTITIEYDDDPNYSDVEVSDNKLVRKSIDNGQYSKENPYSEGFVGQVYIPSIEMKTDLVGDTEMISTFIDKYKLNVNWIHWLDNAYRTTDIAISPFACNSDGGLYSRRDSQCAPPHQHVPIYIWTRYPQEISELSM